MSKSPADWYNLGKQGGGTVSGKAYTAKECFINCLEIDAENFDEENLCAWYNLGFEGGGTVSGKEYTAKECFTICVEIDARFFDAWNKLGTEGGGTVSGKAYSAKECYINCLEMIDTYDCAWNGLGDQGGGNVSGKAYTAKECYISCLEIDATFHSAWSGLGTQGGGTVSGKTYSAKECYIKCLELEATFHSAWSGLGTQGGGTVSGKTYTAKECYIKCLEIDTKYHQAWNNLGNRGGGTFSGTAYTAKECYIKCLELEAAFHSAWSGLGLQGGGTVSSKEYTAKECFTKCLEIDDSFYDAWANLGILDGGIVNSIHYSSKDCRYRAMNVDFSRYMQCFWMSSSVEGSASAAPLVGDADTPRFPFAHSVVAVLDLLEPESTLPGNAPLVAVLWRKSNSSSAATILRVFALDDPMHVLLDHDISSLGQAHRAEALDNREDPDRIATAVFHLAPDTAATGTVFLEVTMQSGLNQMLEVKDNRYVARVASLHRCLYNSVLTKKMKEVLFSGEAPQPPVVPAEASPSSSFIQIMLRAADFTESPELLRSALAALDSFDGAPVEVATELHRGLTEISRHLARSGNPVPRPSSSSSADVLLQRIKRVLSSPSALYADGPSPSPLPLRCQPQWQEFAAAIGQLSDIAGTLVLALGST